MKRKLQVFVSSTLDLKEERQAAVEAILEAGHIPAGMELFATGDKSQLDTVRRWINDSDVYVLILGGRYGTIDPESGKSYIELEYLHAVDRGMPYFALVLKEATLEAKIKRDGLTLAWHDNPALLKQFTDVVTRKNCGFVEGTKDLKLSIHKSLKEITDNNPGLGWVPAKENADAEFERIFKALLSARVDYHGEKAIPLRVLLDNKEIFITGIHNAINAPKDMDFLFYRIAPLLKIHGLIEDHRRPGAKYDIQRMSKLGLDFIAWSLEKLSAEAQTTQPQVAPQASEAKPTPEAPAQTEDASIKRRAKPQSKKKPK